MAGYGIAIRMAEPTAPGSPPDGLVLQYHLTDRVQLDAEFLSGGHLLHLAVAGCLLNDILREARRRGIALTRLEVTADGAFAGQPATSTGIAYAVAIAGDAPDDELRTLVADCERDASIPLTLRQGTTVTGGDVLVG